MIFFQLINIYINRMIINDSVNRRDIYDFVGANPKFCLYFNNSLSSWAPKEIYFCLNELKKQTIEYGIYLLWTRAFTLYIIATFFIYFFLFIYLFYFIFISVYFQTFIDKKKQFMFFDYNESLIPTIDLVYIEYYYIIIIILIIIIIIHGFLGYINIYTDYVYTNDSGFLSFIKYIIIIMIIILIIYIYFYSCGMYYYIV